MKQRTKNRITFIGMFLGGLILNMIFIPYYQQNELFLESAKTTQGEVVDFKKVVKGKKPIVYFIDDRGNEHSFESSSYSNPPKYKVGDTVPVIYNNSLDEFKAHIYEESTVFAMKYVPFLFGGGFMLIGLVGGYIFWNRDTDTISVSFVK